MILALSAEHHFEISMALITIWTWTALAFCDWRYNRKHPPR